MWQIYIFLWWGCLLSITKAYRFTSFITPFVRLRSIKCSIDEAATSANLNTHSHSHSQTDDEPFVVPQFDAIRSSLLANISKLEQSLCMLDENIKNVNYKVHSAKDELQALENEYGSEIDRLRKEFDRIRERSAEEYSEAIDKSKIDAIKGILPTLDNLIRAQQAFQPLETENEKAISSYYEAIYQKLSELVNSYGVNRVECVGKLFDVNTMEALQSTANDQPAGTVIMEYQPGYILGSKCIIPALVVVSSGPGLVS